MSKPNENSKAIRLYRHNRVHESSDFVPAEDTQAAGVQNVGYPTDRTPDTNYPKTPTNFLNMFGFMTGDQRGYTRGSLDVVTAINLFLKFILISPVLLFAGYVSLAMMKHVIFQGIPAMNKPTEQQEQRIREADEQIGMPTAPVAAPASVAVTPAPVTTAIRPQPPVVREEPAPPIVRPQQTPRMTKEEYEARRMKKYCIETWLPKYGHNPNAIAAGGPCFQYVATSRPRPAPTSSRLERELEGVRPFRPN